jgi:hypothetical protein
MRYLLPDEDAREKLAAHAWQVSVCITARRPVLLLSSRAVLYGWICRAACRPAEALGTWGTAGQGCCDMTERHDGMPSAAGI